MTNIWNKRGRKMRRKFYMEGKRKRKEVEKDATVKGEGKGKWKHI